MIEFILSILCALICWGAGWYSGWYSERQKTRRIERFEEACYQEVIGNLKMMNKQLATENNMLRKKLEEANNERKAD